MKVFDNYTARTRHSCSVTAKRKTDRQCVLCTHEKVHVFIIAVEEKWIQVRCGRGHETKLYLLGRGR